MEKTGKKKGQSTPSKTKGGDKEKHAKRPMSAFFFFSQSLREEVKKTGENTGGIEGLAKLAGQRWKELSDTAKKPFEEQAAADKERYQRELASGLTVTPRKSKKEKKKSKDEKDPNKPKRANSAYLYFSADFRKSKDAQGVKHTDIMKLAAQKWKDLSDSEKKKYFDMEKKDKDRYKKEMESYKPKTLSKKSPKPAKASKATKASSPSQDSEGSNEDDDEDEDVSDE